MAIEKKVVGELTALVSPIGEVEIEQTGLGFKYEITISSIDAAIAELCQIVEWLTAISKNHSTRED